MKDSTYSSSETVSWTVSQSVIILVEIEI